MANTDIAASGKGIGFSSLFAAIQSASDLQLAYSALRITLGMNIFFHGAMRLITGLDAWATVEAGLFTKQPVLPMWSVIAGFTVATSVGLFFGLWPAVKAARLDPIAALRYE